MNHDELEWQAQEQARLDERRGAAADRDGYRLVARAVRTAPMAAGSDGVYRPSIQAPPPGANTAFSSSATKETSPPRRKTAETIRVRATVQA